METRPHSILYYVHDPMCSWCWGFRRIWDQLRLALPDSVRVINLVGGLAPDTSQTMPIEQQKTIAGYWQQVAKETGAEFNFEFWERCQPRRSTYPACRALLAARKQDAELAMIDAIQHAYYLRAMNPSDNSVLIQLAEEQQLDTKLFASDLTSPETELELQREFALRRSLGVYSFPSLVLARGEQLTPIEINYHSIEPALSRIVRLNQSQQNSAR